MSLRERKKEATRAAFIRVSQRMFTERGYTATTLEDICAEVEVRPQTLLRYFPSKVHLAVAPWADQVGVIVERLGDPHRTRPALEVWRTFVEEEATAVATSDDPVLGDMLTNHVAFNAWADKDQTLVAMNSDLQRRCEAALATALAADAGLVRPDLDGTLLAARLVTARRFVFERWVSDGGSLAAEQLAVIDDTVSRLERTSPMC